MATERNVVDFKIHNLTEEQFQELKAQGKIDPNAVYCTPDESLKTDQITNCLTEIPQDFKLELAGGKLTLKAGSKVYVPNGVGRFDVIDIKSDISISYTSNRKCFLYYYNGALNFTDAIQNCVSGDTDTLAGQKWHTWYDTGNNVIKRYTSDATTPDYTGISLPLAAITISSSGTSIDQVFNGFGYIGSTVFVLPGVKGLVSEGFNSDGTLKNTITTTSSVKTIDVSSRGYVALTPYDSNRLVIRSNYYIVNNQSEMNSLNVAGFYYVKQENKCYSWSGGSGTKYNEYIPCIKIYCSSGKITEFSKDLSFRAVDYNDTEYMAHQPMPSSRYVDLTLPESGGTITAPADGWLILIKTSGAANEYLAISARVSALQMAYSSGTDLTLAVPVSKSETVHFYYTATRDTKRFRFIYAYGAK